MPDANPKTARGWKKAVKQHLPVPPDAILLSNLTGTTSASCLTFSHFLCLKVLWESKEGVEFALNQYVDKQSIALAKHELGKPKAKAFLSNIKRKQYPDDSIFSLVDLYMDLVFDLNESSDWTTAVLLPPRPIRQEAPRRRSPESPSAGRGHSSQPTKMDIDSDSQSDSQSDTSMEDVSQMETGLQPPESPSSGGSDSENDAGRESAASKTEFMPTEDEAIVNMAFVLLLNSLTEPYAPMRHKGYRWLTNHEPVRIFKKLSATGQPLSVRENKLLEARTDGCFRHTGHNISAALIEVKPCVRKTAQERIEWQEGAQMAAYIYKLLYMQSPPSPGFGLLLCDKPGLKRRLLVSQDHAEIYINIAEYDAAYERYLGLHDPRNASAPPPPQAAGGQGNAATRARKGFLTMRCFGPWRIDTPADRKYICEALLAFSFYLTNLE